MAKAKITIDTSNRKFPIAQELYGLIFEDINRAGDGGLYPEMIRNRSFEDTVLPERCTYLGSGKMKSPTGWETSFPEPESLEAWSVYQAENGEIDTWIQDALDVVEYANGDVSTYWGSLRAKMDTLNLSI